MKKFLYTALFYGAAVFLMSTSNGSPGGYTGSPNDPGGRTCGTAGGCHSTVANDQTMISTNIPATGYVGGDTYTITLTAIASGINKYGFELKAEDVSGSQTGIFTANSEVKILSMGTGMNNATHMNSSNNGMGSRTWTVDWTAPTVGSGDVTFYAAVVAANGNNGTSGDLVFKDSHIVSEASGIGINELSFDDQFKLYPNPVNESTRLTFEMQETGSLNIQIFSINGQEVMSESHNVQIGINDIPLNLSTSVKGTFLMSLNLNGKIYMTKLVKN